MPRALALYVRSASPASTRRTPRAWRTSWRTTPRTKPRARTRLNAALALIAKRLGPDDTARAKQFLDAGDLAACARLLLARYYDKLYDRHLGRRGDAVLAVRAADPFDADAVADAVVATVSRADAADLPPPPPVEATRPPPRDRDDDGVQWCAPS